MKKSVFSCLFLLIFASCESVRIKPPRTSERLISVEKDPEGNVRSVACILTPANYPQDPVVILPIEDCDGTIGTSLEEYKLLNAHFTSVTKRLEVCLNVPKKCR